MYVWVLSLVGKNEGCCIATDRKRPSEMDEKRTEFTKTRIKHLDGLPLRSPRRRCLEFLYFISCCEGLCAIIITDEDGIYKKEILCFF